MKKLLIVLFMLAVVGCFADENVKGIPSGGTDGILLCKDGDENPMNNYRLRWLILPANSLLCTEESDVIKTIPKDTYANEQHTHSFADILTDAEHRFISDANIAEIDTALSNSELAVSTADQAVATVNGDRALVEKAVSVSKRAQETASAALTIAERIDDKATQALANSVDAKATADSVRDKYVSCIVLMCICFGLFIFSAIGFFVLLNKEKL